MTLLTACRINVKLGGINSIPDPRSVAFLTDPKNPTIVMGYYSSPFLELTQTDDMICM